jgi:hypothetical protein
MFSGESRSVHVCLFSKTIPTLRCVVQSALAVLASTAAWAEGTIAENETAARLDLCKIIGAQWAYYEDHQEFAVTFYELGELQDPEGPGTWEPYLPGDWGQTRNGYNFSLSGFKGFTVNADPAIPETTGNRRFFTDMTGTVRARLFASADDSSPPAGEACLPEPAASDPSARALEYLCSVLQAEELYFKVNLAYGQMVDLTEHPLDPTGYYEVDYLTPVPAATLGYNVTLNRLAAGRRFEILASPVVETPETPHYYADETGMIRQSLGAPANAASAPVSSACATPAAWLNRLRAQIYENEEAARADVCKILSAQYAYHHDTGCFSPDLIDLVYGEVPYLDGQLDDWWGTLHGYDFSVRGAPNPNDPEGFTVKAQAAIIGSTGVLSFYTDASGTIRSKSYFDANDPYGEADFLSPLDPFQCVEHPFPYDNAALALQYLCAIVEAQQNYRAVLDKYSPSFDRLIYPSFLAEGFTGNIAGYAFTLDATVDSFTVNAAPAYITESSVYYFADETGLIRQRIGGGPAVASDPLVSEACVAPPPLVHRQYDQIVDNHAFARARLCAIHAAQQAYFNDHAAYADNMESLLQNGPPYLAALPPLQCQPYEYALAGNVQTYSATASAASYGATGVTGYFINQTGILRQTIGADASAASEIALLQCDEIVNENPAIHAIDIDGNGVITLSEVLRAVQFYNVGTFHCMEGTEDGFAPGAGNTTCAPHDLDYAPQDWHINVTELSRIIQFYNARGYHSCPDQATEDGFCPFAS